jgi:hypothetical protein
MNLATIRPDITLQALTNQQLLDLINLYCKTSLQNVQTVTPQTIPPPTPTPTPAPPSNKPKTICETTEPIRRKTPNNWSDNERNSIIWSLNKMGVGNARPDLVLQALNNQQLLDLINIYCGTPQGMLGDSTPIQVKPPPLATAVPTGVWWRENVNR